MLKFRVRTFVVAQRFLVAIFRLCWFLLKVADTCKNYKIFIYERACIIKGDDTIQSEGDKSYVWGNKTDAQYFN